MEKHALILWAPGFEEIEAVAPADILVRAGVHVTTAGVNPGPCKGSRGVEIVPERSLEDVLDQTFDAVVLPGGMGGAQNLFASEEVKILLHRARAEQWWIAAICAAPALVLSPLNLLKGHKATGYPSMLDQLDAAEAIEAPVVVDKKLITSAGPATAILFGLAIAEALVGKEKAQEVARAMLVPD